MFYRIPYLQPKSIHAFKLDERALSRAVDDKGYIGKVFKNTLKSSCKPLLFFALLVSASPLSAAEGERAKGWNLAQNTAGETAAPPELDIDSAREAQKTQPEPSAEQLEPTIEQPEPSKQLEPGKEQPEISADSASSDSDLEASNSDYPSSDSATRAPIPTTPVIDLNPELRTALERQFQQMRKLLETEDAFSEALGEVYLSYGSLLLQAGRLEESRKMLVNALHITKVNNGVNSIEQRPVLRALFEMNFARQNTEELENNLRQIIWLEKKVPELADDYSFDMIVRLGNHFLDQYLQNPRITEYNLENLRKATRYFRLAVNRYGDRPLSQLFMPYGELAYSNFLKSRIETEVSRSYNDNTRQRTLGDLNRFPEPSSSRPRGTLGGSFAVSERYLQEYLDKANKEDESEHVVQALLNLGDLNILFGRRVGAMGYYEKAWDASQQLPVSHPIVQSFDSPQLLPAFNFSDARPATSASDQILSANDDMQLVPLTFDIDTDGNVKRVAKEALDGTSGWSLSRAKRIARKMKFRPIIENGKLVKSIDHRQDIRIKVRSTGVSDDTSSNNGASARNG